MTPSVTLTRALLGLLIAAATVPAAAVLVGRDLDPGRSGYEAYYDTDQNLTWLADGNHARSSGRSADGQLTFHEAMSWAAQVDIHGVSGWRLPAFRVPQQTGCVRTASHNSCDVPTAQSELMHLLRVGLGLRSIFETSQDPYLFEFDRQGLGWQVPGVDPGVLMHEVMSNVWAVGLRLQEVACPDGADCGTPTEGFASAPAPSGYWSANGQVFVRCLIPAHCEAGRQTRPLPVDPVTGLPRQGYYFTQDVRSAWRFDMLTADHVASDRVDNRAAVWLVHDGDVGTVPEPATGLLVGAGLALAWRRRQVGAQRPAASNPG